jgi:hypothetical protein
MRPKADSVGAFAASLSAGGDNRTIGRDVPLVLDAASVSSDPNELSFFLSADFSWSCELTDTVSAGTDLSACPSAVTEAFLVTKATTGVVEVGAGQLPLGMVLRFRVTATSGGRASSASQEVVVVAGNPPQVMLAHPNC